MESYNKNYFYEVQQRAAEYSVLQNCSNDQLKTQITQNIPTPKEDNIKDKNLMDENEEDDTENVVKLKSIPVKQVNETGGSFSIPANIGDIIDNMNLLPTNENQEDKKEDNASKEQNGLNLLDLNNIFGGSGNENNPIPNAENTNTKSANPFDLFDINMESNSNPIPSTNVNPISNINQGLFDVISQSQPQQQQTPASPQIKECFKNEDITLYYQINKTSDTNYDGTVYASNNSDEVIDNIKINLMVLKFVTVKVLSTSGTSLEKHQGLGIRKDFSMVSSDPNKKVVMKVKLVYQIKGHENNATVTIDDF